MAQFNTTELDFEKIKSNLTNYFKRSGGPFRDYDFAGSGLDHLIDILAYNTHYNAINAHMAMNESFLDSAQIRGNVVSRAKLLGYTPKSVTAASASINLVVNRKEGASDVNLLTIPKGTQFTTTINDNTFIFETEQAVTTQIDSGDSTFTFNNLIIKQGATRVENYSIDNSYDQRFIINSQKVDTSTLKVEVFDTLAAEEGTQSTYSLFSEFPNVDGTSKLYFIDENADGNYEIRFGNNLFGSKPTASGLVRLTYLISDGSVANGANSFTFKDGQTGFENIEPGSSVVTTVSKAASGNESESIESIKYNAPLSFIAQERAVTADDFKSLIMKNFTGLDNVTAWGGETEARPQFGKIYISVKPTAAEYLTPLQKQEILSLLKSKKVVGMTPEIVDPEYIYVFFEIFFKYNPTGTTTSAGGLAAIVKQVLTTYNQNELNNFDGVFRHSNLLSRIDSANSAILNSVARVKAYKNVRITSNSLDSESADFGFKLDGDVEQPKSMISTTPILIGGKSTYLADEPIAGDNEKRKIYGYVVDSQGRQSRTVNDAGFVYPEIGLIDLVGLINDQDEVLTITVRPASDDIISSKRKVLQIDINKTTIIGDVDNISIAGSAGLSNYTTFTRD